MILPTRTRTRCCVRPFRGEQGKVNPSTLKRRIHAGASQLFFTYASFSIMHCQSLEDIRRMNCLEYVGRHAPIRQADAVSAPKAQKAPAPWELLGGSNAVTATDASRVRRPPCAFMRTSGNAPPRCALPRVPVSRGSQNWRS
ncbi:hypothetical protein B0H12DRAFT_1114664 [Mycena haematopus]|nr:hypothetical protein B0H12DRAFT_1114664 [Mycena haematopus]